MNTNMKLKISRHVNHILVSLACALAMNACGGGGGGGGGANNDMSYWPQQLRTTSDEEAMAMTRDGANNIYISGYTSGDLDGNTSAGSADYFITKYASNGTKQWTLQHGGSAGDFVYAITVDGNANIYIAGTTLGDLDGNTSLGSMDSFVSKYTSNGMRLWTRQIATTAYDAALGIALDSSNNVYVIGMTTGSLDGVSRISTYDAFLMKFSTDGTWQ